MNSAAFGLGRIVATPGALEALGHDTRKILSLVTRHQRLEQGALGREDHELNREAVKNGDRVFSCFEEDGHRVYVITEWDRSVTTLLLPEEY